MSIPPDGKLVRDHIPDIIRSDGRAPNVVRLEAAQRLPALLAKLHEETAELAAATDAEVLGELADVLEVLRALAQEHDLSWWSVDAEAARKRVERGGFDEGWFLRT
jgi:predicted house-cleaning noncanonical NTP pyrophosphatase (MazG superfamily)